jgi:FKBP-type peptidyl-prolyl cis-trans isomerase
MATTTDPKIGSGVLVRTLRKGYGSKPCQGDSVLVHYEGFFLRDVNNMGPQIQATRASSFTDSSNANSMIHPTPFCSSYANQTPMKVVIGEEFVMKGWQEVLPHLQLGQLVEVTIPHIFAYGEQGYPPMIPSKTNLLFRMEIIHIERKKERKWFGIW